MSDTFTPPCPDCSSNNVQLSPLPGNCYDAECLDCGFAWSITPGDSDHPGNLQPDTVRSFQAAARQERASRAQEKTKYAINALGRELRKVLQMDDTEYVQRVTVMLDRENTPLAFVDGMIFTFKPGNSSNLRMADPETGVLSKTVYNLECVGMLLEDFKPEFLPIPRPGKAYDVCEVRHLSELKRPFEVVPGTLAFDTASGEYPEYVVLIRYTDMDDWEVPF